MPGDGNRPEGQRGGQQWDGQTFGDMAGAMRVPWGMAKGPCGPQTLLRQGHGRKTRSFKGWVLPPARAGECPAELGWSRAHSHPEVVPKPLHHLREGIWWFLPHRQAEGRSQYLRRPESWLLGTQTGCIWGARHSQRPPVLPERRMLRPILVESCQA